MGILILEDSEARLAGLNATNHWHLLKKMLTVLILFSYRNHS